MIRRLFTFWSLFGWCAAAAQTIPGNSSDTVRLLSEIVVKGFAYDRPLSEVPATIGYVDTRNLERFNNASILPAVNTIPGVRMEERSPGSYRFAIRGSSLRSPFGVREVKMYWNGLPLTDGGGNTYLNLLDFNSIGSAEIIKGPGASLYGAGSGGVMLLRSPSIKESHVQFSASGGSYGLQRYQFAAQTASENVNSRIQYAHQQGTGYRDQTSMRRDALNTDVNFKLGKKSKLSASIFYTDLYYQTPGGLTQTQYNANPQQARQGASALQAAVYNKTIYSGLMHEYEWNNHWSNRTGVYGAYTQFENPTFRNYEKRNETNWGGRTETQYKWEREKWRGKLTFGGEFQYFNSPLTDYGNVNGKPDTVQVADKLGSTQTLIFVQTELELPSRFYLTVGGSTTFLQYRFTRLSDVPVTHDVRNFNPVLSPRLALLKKISSNLSIFGSVSQGFSTPTLAEVRPSSNTYNSSLNPEIGSNYEMGFRGQLIQQKISFDVAAYYFMLNNTIVSPDGGDHYINAGKTSQPGLEIYVAWTPIANPAWFISSLKVWNSYTYNPYTFKNYVVGSSDYTGHQLTGVARNIEMAGLDVITRPGIYMNVTFNSTSAIAVNDASTAYASGFVLLAARGGYRTGTIKKMLLELYGGVDNALNARYSLGNDLNAVGGRYYNAAPLRNFYLGLKGTF